MTQASISISAAAGVCASRVELELTPLKVTVRRMIGYTVLAVVRWGDIRHVEDGCCLGALSHTSHGRGAAVKRKRMILWSRTDDKALSHN